MSLIGRAVCGLTLASVVLLLGTSASAGEEPETPEVKPPILSIEGADDLELVLAGTGEPSLLQPSSWPLWDDNLAGSIRVVVTNTGPEDADVAFELVATDSESDCDDVTPEFTPDDPVPASGSRTYDLEVTTSSDCVGRSALLVVSSTGAETDEASDPKTAAVELSRHIGGWDFGPPLVAATIAFFAFLLGAGISTWSCRSDRTPGGDAWSFSGSWLTSISAIGTALAGVLAASGFVTELLPGIPLGNFLGLSLTFGGLVVAAPMVFALAQTVDWKVTGEPGKQVRGRVVAGRIFGLVGAGACTCAGVFGLLAMLAVLTPLSNAGSGAQIVVLSLLVVAAGIVAAYVVVSTKNAVQMRTDPPSSAPDEAIPLGIVPTPTDVTGITGTL